MTDRETLEILAKIRESVLIDLGDLLAVSAIDKAIAAYGRELDQSEAEKARTNVETVLRRRLAIARLHVERLADRITNFKAHTATDRECTVRAGLAWLKEAGL